MSQAQRWHTDPCTSAFTSRARGVCVCARGGRSALIRDSPNAPRVHRPRAVQDIWLLHWAGPLATPPMPSVPHAVPCSHVLALLGEASSECGQVSSHWDAAAWVSLHVCVRHPVGLQAQNHQMCADETSRQTPPPDLQPQQLPLQA